MLHKKDIGDIPFTKYYFTQGNSNTSWFSFFLGYGQYKKIMFFSYILRLNHLPKEKEFGYDMC